jgi:hypothetical protein
VPIRTSAPVEVGDFGEVTPDDDEESDRIDRELANSARLQTADFSQGSASLAQYRSIVEPTRASVVVVLNEGIAVGLGIRPAAIRIVIEWN